jgi:UDP-glucose 4-epimerase
MSKVVVTGSAGFIGGYVVQELLDQGHHVIGLDNFSKYGQVNNSYDKNDNFTFIKGDAQDLDLMVSIIEDADHLIAGAALIGGISYFHTYAYDLLATNERIIASTCDAAIKVFPKGKLKKVTYLSSSMVYESTTHWPSVEGDEKKIPPPISSYGFQKLAVEYFARAAWDQYRIPFTILRPFNCVGIGERRAKGDIELKSGNISLAMSHVVPDLIQKILKGQNPLQIFGDGSQVRCYTYGGDLAKGIVKALESDMAYNEDFNLSASQVTSVIELSKLIWHKIKGDTVPLNFVYEKPFEHDVKMRIPNVEKARQRLGFEANTTLDEMLDEVIPWIKKAIADGLI